MFYQYPSISDENIFQEFCKDVYNEIYKTTSFQLYKTKGAAQFGIDSYSIEERIVIQSKKKKLLRSDKDLEKELVDDLTETIQMVKSLPFEFDQLIFATNTKRYSTVEDLAALLSQSGDFPIKFVSWENFEGYISDYSSIRKKYFPAYFRETGTSPKILTYLPPFDPESVIGRNSELLDISQKLTNRNPVVSVNGMGGIGKTTIVKFVLHRQLSAYDHVLWIDHSTSPDDDNDFLTDFTSNFALLSNLGINYAGEHSVEELMGLIKTRLANLSGRNLLIIDNAPSSILSINHLLPGLPNWQKLITSRIRLFEENIFELAFLDLSSSIGLFLKYYSIENNADTVGAIVAIVGFHTLTIELLAKTANKRRLKLAELVQMLESQGVNISKAAKITSDHDLLGNAATPFNYLLSIFSIADLAAERQLVLSCFSVLSTQSIVYEDLKLLFQVGHDDNEFFDTLNELFETGWLLQTDDQYTMHQVIQEVVREKTKPTAASLENLIATLAELLLGDWGSNPLNSKRFIQHSQQLLNIVSVSSVQSASLSNALGLRQEDFGDLKKH